MAESAVVLKESFWGYLLAFDNCCSWWSREMSIARGHGGKKLKKEKNCAGFDRQIIYCSSQRMRFPHVQGTTTPRTKTGQIRLLAKATGWLPLCVHLPAE